MMSVGMIVAYIGYAILYWGLQAIQGNNQASFITYIFPFAR